MMSLTIKLSRHGSFFSDLRNSLQVSLVLYESKTRIFDLRRSFTSATIMIPSARGRLMRR